MAKKKEQIEEIEDDIEDKDLAEEQDDEEDVVEEKEDSEKEDSSEDASEDSDEASEESTKEDPEREAIRERRRREKKMKRERDRRERAQLQNTIVAMAEEIKKLKDGHGEVSKKFEGLTSQQIQGEISELSKIYNQAQAAMEAAIADGDGKRFTQAKAISDKAWARYTFLETQKQQRTTQFQENKQQKSQQEKNADKESVAESSSESVQLGSDGKRYGMAFVNKHKSWYDPNGNNRDSKVVLTIDADLYNEGYDPETKEYWDELEDRVKEYLPHRVKSMSQKPKPKNIVGGSGNDNYSPGTAEKSLPKEFVQTLKAAGYWDDATKRKAAIKNYYANKKGA